jgi:16S rRNA (guanine1207-N2)-methyltransferase
MARRREGEWRDWAAADLLLSHWEDFGLAEPVLVMNDPLPRVAEVLASRGLHVSAWNRRAWGGRTATPWPMGGPFRSAALRLPRSKGEATMALHAAASVLHPGGSVLVYGSNDEGMRPVPGLMEDLFSAVGTVAVGGRCRVVTGRWEGGAPELRGDLEAWKECMALTYPGLPATWVTYPGVFSSGELDPGTRLLLDLLPPLPAGARVLDFGCGSGIVGAVAMARGDGVRATLLDVDTVALEAARANLPGADVVAGDGPGSAGGEPFDAIFSNPPLHRGKAEDPRDGHQLHSGGTEAPSA